MKNRRLPGLGLFVLVAAGITVASLAAPEDKAAQPDGAGGAVPGKVDFVRDVQPIFKAACNDCHGEKKPKGKLRLDAKELALKGGTSGPAIVPGKAKESYLVKRIKGEGGEDRMPLDHPPLTDAQIKTIEKWIDEGAQWPDEASVKGAVIKQHWAYVPPVRPAMPEVKDKAWVKNHIDALVLARLEKEGLKPGPEADRHTLIRRLSLDLIGLPPTPEEIDAFVTDKSANAYERLVERLLNSPHYGERWARRWLDLARYADTNGYEKDRPRVIWPYRDWVINALNADMPFDQFTIEQIAGDMLPNATLDQKIATGFHRNTMRNEEGGTDPLEYRFYAMVDRVGTTATTWLGLTLACAQCHNHKYDALSHKEYYSFMAFLDNTEEPELEVPDEKVSAKRAEAQKRIDELTEKLPEKFPASEVKFDLPEARMQVSAAADITKVQQMLDRSWRFHAAEPEKKKEDSDNSDKKEPALPAGKQKEDGPDKDVYTFTFDSDAVDVDRLRLTAIRDGKIGPGRAENGNFVLTEIKVTAAPIDAPDLAEPVKFSRAEADYAQNNFPISNAIDGKPDTGWAVDGRAPADRTATFFFDKPVNYPGGTRWTVTLEQQWHKKHTIARAKIALGSKVKDERPVEARRKEAMEQAFASWLRDNSTQTVEWTVLKPGSLKSNAPMLTDLGDGSVLASGDITKSDLYEVTIPGKFQGITAIRLEALTHDSLPRKGPGKVFYEGPDGDFYLSEFNVEADGKPVVLGDAAHDFASAQNFARNAIDGNPQTGWSIDGGQGKPHYAVFIPAQPFTAEQELKIKILCERYFASALGRFRLSVTTSCRSGGGAALPPEIEEALATPSDVRSTGQQEALFKYWLGVAPELTAARREIENIRNGMPKMTSTLVMNERPAPFARQTRLHHRGEFLQPKEVVDPGVPAVLPAIPKDGPRNRLTLAKWLVSRDNPLTARVTVNRQWAALFGRGLVRTTEDFGVQGEAPSHPELLDYLAVEFMEQGWSLKKLHKLIVMSATYRQSSRVTPELVAKDPRNVLLARGPRFRLEAELVRDSALRASGLMSARLGGPSVFPPQPPTVTTEGAYGPLAWNVSQGADRFRRSLYTFAKRTAPFAMFNTFDAPSGEACVARREISNTPLQALTLLNDTVFIEAAQALGRMIGVQKESDEERAKEIYTRVLSRPPEKEELEAVVAFAKKQRERFSKKELDPAKVAGPGEGDAVERAVWTTVARAVLNTDEAVTKN